jgi:uncharacterized membrane protein
MKKLLYKLKNSLWLLPTIYSIIGLSLAIITITIDMNYLSQWEKFIPDLFLTSVDLASKILVTLSSALLTMSTFTFSIIMVVLTTYASQFSPRALPNFMSEKTTMRVLGIFLGAFIYSIYSLVFMRKSLENEYVISAVIGVFITIICLLFFIQFIHFIGKSIQVDYLIEKLTNETLQTTKFIKEQQQKNQLEIVKDYEPVAQHKKSYYSNQTAYLQLVDIEELVLIASKYNLFIQLHHKIGEFITEESVLFSIYTKENSNTEHLLHLCAKHISLNPSRTTTQDLSFSIQKLVEIALRATSPAINDPFTAKHCIRDIGKVLLEISPLLQGHLLFKDKNEEQRLIIPTEDLQNLLYNSFYRFELKNRKDLPILGAILDALILTAKKATAHDKKIIWGFYTYLTYHFPIQELHDFDEEFLRIKRAMLFDATH